MQPVICFHEHDRYYYSEEYDVFLHQERASLKIFLLEISQRFFGSVKILQINFDGFTAQLNRPLVKDDPVATVYVLKSIRMITGSDISVPENSTPARFTPDITREDFIAKVNQIKSEIARGRFYQVNLTSSYTARRTSPEALTDLEVFGRYFDLFKAPLSVFLPSGTHPYAILCYSPELFLEKIGTLIRTEPIKGTLRSDHLKDLLESEKEKAELAMIVDLMRNDLQQICDRPVQVKQHRAPLKLNYTTHTFSEIAGDTVMTLPEILAKMLPGGSISGCPKVESLRAIDELEPFARHFYTGCIGWWKGNDFKLNLAIRSFMLTPKKIKYFTGCGIVHDSKPDEEWKEFLKKATHLNLADNVGIE